MEVQNLPSFCDREPWSVFDFSTVFKEGGGVGSEALSKSEIYLKNITSSDDFKIFFELKISVRQIF